LAWDNQPTWDAQAHYWEKLVEEGLMSGISYSLIISRPVFTGTMPTSYRPDPLHGSMEDFTALCHRMADKGIPVLIWMSHAGLAPGNPEIDEDWFIRGVDGQRISGWGNRNAGMCYCNHGHPGYIEYTKKWIRFYIKECRCKGIFFDCYGTGVPIDYTPRPFMRYPGDTPLGVIRFMEEIYACVKECDPEAIVLGEGCSLDGPVNIFSLAMNPRQPGHAFGPRDFLLELNKYSKKRIVIDQGPMFHLGGGISKSSTREDLKAHAKYMVKLLAQRGCRDAVNLPGDLSILDNLLVVPFPNEGPSDAKTDIQLPAPWDQTRALTEEITGARIPCTSPGVFPQVPPGFYKMA